jgi:Peptidase family M28
MYKHLVWLFVATINILPIYSQYISSVTIPDATKPIITDTKIPELRAANSISAKSLRNHLTILASDSLEGRETGKPGIDKAKDYILKQLNNLGIGAIPRTSIQLQPVSFTFHSWKDAEIFVNKIRYKHLWDFISFPNLNNTFLNINDTEVIFMGYGIDDAKYSDYKKANVKDKIILINRGEPVNTDSISYISGSKSMSTWSNEDMERKLKIAKSKGVKLVLIIENDIKKLLDKNRNKLMGNNLDLGNTQNQVLETASHCYISTTIAKAIIDKNEGKIIKARAKMAKGKPANVNLKTTLLGTSLVKNVTLLEGNNIIATIEGKSKTDEYVIVSAHYDHLGIRGDEVFNGADDNGSGTSTLIELAKVSMNSFLQNDRAERSISYIWFCGEEKGLLGSLYYSKNPVYPLNQTVADVNVDMVGRQDEKYKDNPDYIYVIGSDRLSSDLHKINEENNQKYTQLTLDYTYNSENDPNNYYYRSDHYNFAKNGIPSIFFFSGVHEDYHKKTDDVEKINFDKMAKIAKLIYLNIWSIASRPERLVVDGEIK